MWNARLTARTVSFENARLRSPMLLTPTRRARSPATIENGGASRDSFAFEAAIADSPTRLN